ncbi:MAG: ABC transporter ATP-binding protein, partial [Planctomycetota bacterium]
DHPHAARARVGYLPETSPLYPEMRVDAYLHFVGRLFAMTRAQRKRRIDQLTDRCGLGAIRSRVIGTLSRGNRQRVGVAQALLHEPPAIILDEPTAGLDPRQSLGMRDLLESLRGAATVLVSSHILADVERLADRMLVIDHGKLVHDGPPHDLRRQLAGGSVRIECQAEPERLRKTLAGTPFGLIEPIDDTTALADDAETTWRAYRVKPAEPGGELRDELWRRLSAASIPTRELTRESAPLERLFEQLAAPPDQASPSEDHA